MRRPLISRIRTRIVSIYRLKLHFVRCLLDDALAISVAILLGVAKFRLGAYASGRTMYFVLWVDDRQISKSQTR
jgi:hypothetical protein